MAMQLKTTKAKSKQKLGQNVIIVFLVIAMILTVIIVNYASSSALRNTVEIAVLTADLPKDGALTSKSQFEKVEMQMLEYERIGVMKNSKGQTASKLVLWKNVDKLLASASGYYASVYIRAGRPLYWEDLSTTATQKNSYLYSMDGELIKLDITPKDFGDMVVPGDKLNVRITYEKNDYTLPTESQFQKMAEAGATTKSTVTVTETLFSEVAILDMLNGNGESIFDLYYELLTYPQAQRDAIINSSDFKSKVSPKCILMAVTAEEAERYAKLKANKNGQYLITLLPRDGTTEILDALDELKTGFARK